MRGSGEHRQRHLRCILRHDLLPVSTDIGPFSRYPSCFLLVNPWAAFDILLVDGKNRKVAAYHISMR